MKDFAGFVIKGEASHVMLPAISTSFSILPEETGNTS